MTGNLPTRRECARGMLGALALPPGRTAAVSSAALAFEVWLARGKIVLRKLTNRLANESVDLPAEVFALEFDDGVQVASGACTTTLAAANAGRIELLFANAGLEVRVRYELPPGKAYVRKRIAVRQSGGKPRRLLRADLDNWRGIRRKWDSMHADALPYASHPIYCETLWAGVEFVAAFNEYSAEGFLLRSRPGGKPVGAEWVELRSTVAGVAEPGKAREAFLEYIEDVRLAPGRLVACYNSWWTLPLRIGRDEHLALARELSRKLRDAHGVFFDIFATDEGWTDPQTIWKVDRKNLPDGFADIRAIVEAAGGKLGLWMSPSGTYPRSLDYDWARKNGYVVVDPAEAGRRRGVSLACPKYREAAKDQLRALIRENGFDHIKYDGFIAREDRPHDGLLAGRDSVEPLAEYSLELLQASKQANPQLVTEPTYLNSLANYISPWMIRYSDTVWANSGGDCPLGINPAPDYREAHTNAREYYIFSSLNECWLPQNAMQYFDIVHCDDGQGFANHAAMAFGRGRFFVPTYVNPKFMTDDDWRIYAGLLGWARKNRDILRNTVVLPSRVEAGEPYVYGHWLGSRGILAVRNPSNETKPLVVELGRTGAPRQLRDAVCYAQYPYRKGIAAGLAGNGSVSLTLAPWELLFLEIVPRAELSEPVVLGARWRREAGGMALVPDWNVDTVRVIEPKGAERAVRVTPRARGVLKGELLSQAVRQAAEWEWDVECSVSVPPGRGEVLLLVEFPGRERAHRPSRCRVSVNGEPAAARESSSGGHIGYHGPNRGVWQGIQPFESQWTWYICDVGAGTWKVRFTGSASHPRCRLGLWAWHVLDLGGHEVVLPAACPEPAMPPYRPNIERQGISLTYAGVQTRA